jgi:hypothetical protein
VTTDNTAIAFVEHSSFGMLAHGTAAFTFELLGGGSKSSSMTVHLFDYPEYLKFDLGPDIYGNDCPNPKFTSPWNFSLDLNSSNSPYAHIETALEQTVVVPVVFHCDLSSSDYVAYRLTIVYDNIRTRLDYRELVNLTMIPIVIGAWSPAMLAWFLYSHLKRHRMNGIYACLLALVLCFLLTLILAFVLYKRADVSDDANGATIAVIVFEAIFCASVLYS